MDFDLERAAASLESALAAVSSRRGDPVAHDLEHSVRNLLQRATFARDPKRGTAEVRAAITSDAARLVARVEAWARSAGVSFHATRPTTRLPRAAIDALVDEMKTRHSSEPPPALAAELEAIARDQTMPPAPPTPSDVVLPPDCLDADPDDEGAL